MAAEWTAAAPAATGRITIDASRKHRDGVAPSQTLDARIGQDGPWQPFSSDPDEGIAALAEFCRSHAVELMAMEAADGYERRPFGLPCAQAIPVARDRAVCLPCMP